MHPLKTALLGIGLSLAAMGVTQAAEKPNIVVIMVDDMAPMDVSAYNRGLGAVTTPSIDRIAQEGMMVSDYYAQPSCTAGRAAFITGEYPIRTGLTAVGQPGAKVGIQDSDVTLAQLLKVQGYATGMFGKSHIGDRNEYLPTDARFRRILRFSLSLECDGNRRNDQFPQRPEFPWHSAQHDPFGRHHDR